MRRLTRQLISMALTGMLTAVAVYGSWLPMRKSYLFLQAMQDTATIRTPAEFVALLSVPLDAPSPIGQDDLVRDTAREVLRLVRVKGMPPLVTVELVNFVNARSAPILGRGKGIGFGQTLDLLALINLNAYQRTGDREYLGAAESMFFRGLTASPNRPQFLRGLLNVYLVAGDTDKATATAARILALWPDDQVTRDALAKYLARSGAGRTGR